MNRAFKLAAAIALGILLIGAAGAVLDRVEGGRIQARLARPLLVSAADRDFLIAAATGRVTGSVTTLSYAEHYLGVSIPLPQDAGMSLVGVRVTNIYGWHTAHLVWVRFTPPAFVIETVQPISCVEASAVLPHPTDSPGVAIFSAGESTTDPVIHWEYQSVHSESQPDITRSYEDKCVWLHGVNVSDRELAAFAEQLP